jgi:hypothetical protein
MSYEFYKILHLLGIALLLSGLVTLVILKVTGVAIQGTVKKFALITHGIGLVLLLVSGFGLLARLQLMGDFPKWAYIKLAIWLFMGGVATLIKKKGHMAWQLYTIIMCIFLIAAYVGIAKPFTV